MTTLRDLLYDFAGEIIVAEQDALAEGRKDVSVEDLVNEYIEDIKRILIG